MRFHSILVADVKHGEAPALPYALKVYTAHPGPTATVSSIRSPMPDALVQQRGFDLTGYSTLALALVTVFLAIAAFRQAYLSRKAIDATKTETERAFGFDALHQMQALVPIVIAEASDPKADTFRFLNLRNAGLGPAINVRFSGLLNTSEFSAAQYSVPAIAASGIARTSLQLHKDFGQRWPISELLIRYEDIFGNTYSTEYQQFQQSSEWYVWRRPWLYRSLGLKRPDLCSEDEPAWGLKGRVYYDAQRSLY